MTKEIMSIVVPCYNEEKTLPMLINELEKIKKELNEIDLEVILVNDGSKDDTLSVIKALINENPSWLYYISFSRNFGKEAALLAGLEATTGEYIAVMDADLQDPPEMLPEMLGYLKSGEYDVVATRRVDRTGESKVRSFFARLFYKINNKLSEVELKDGARDYRLMTRQVVDSIISLKEHNRFSKGIFSWVGYRVKYLDYHNIERVAGTTAWSFRSLVTYAIDGLTSFSEAPLKIAGWLGFIAFVGASIYGLYIIIDTLVSGNEVPGWPSLAVLIVWLGGLQLLCLGIIGQYIAKIYIETKQRPHYIVREEKLPEEREETKKG